jgi:hypothetical protein
MSNDNQVEIDNLVRRINSLSPNWIQNNYREYIDLCDELVELRNQ